MRGLWGTGSGGATKVEFRLRSAECEIGMQKKGGEQMRSADCRVRIVECRMPTRRCLHAGKALQFRAAEKRDYFLSPLRGEVNHRRVLADRHLTAATAVAEKGGRANAAT